MRNLVSRNIIQSLTTLVVIRAMRARLGKTVGTRAHVPRALFDEF